MARSSFRPRYHAPDDVMSIYQFSETVSEQTPFTPDLRAIDAVLIGSAAERPDGSL